MVEEMAEIIRGQMLAIGVRQALSPVMDVARDPRWGRLGETYGEDPTLCTSRNGWSLTKGLQGKDLKEGVIVTDKRCLNMTLRRWLEWDTQSDPCAGTSSGVCQTIPGCDHGSQPAIRHEFLRLH